MDRTSSGLIENNVGWCGPRAPTIRGEISQYLMNYLQHQLGNKPSLSFLRVDPWNNKLGQYWRSIVDGCGGAPSGQIEDHNAKNNSKPCEVRTINEKLMKCPRYRKEDDHSRIGSFSELIHRVLMANRAATVWHLADKLRTKTFLSD